MRVLLIEDLVDVSDVLKSLLEYEGYEVMAVHTGREGIRLSKALSDFDIFPEEYSGEDI